MVHGVAQTKPLNVRGSLVFRCGVKKRPAFVCWDVVIDNKDVIDKILFSTKNEIIDNLPIESTYPKTLYPWWEFRAPQYY